MAESQFVIKRKILIILLFIFIFSGCEQNALRNNPSIETVKNRSNEESNLVLTTNNDKENSYNIESSETCTKLCEVPINATKEIIDYTSKDNIDLLRALHRSVSDGENIYFAHSLPDLYFMPIGTNEHIPANIYNPDNMDIFHVAFDKYGGIHLLIGDYENEKWFIWQLDENYQVNKTLDISAYFEVNQVPIWFQIDKNGTYFLMWIFPRYGIIIDNEGLLKHHFTPETLGTKWIYEAATGKDGEIYLVHGNQDKKLEIAKLDTKSGLLVNVNPPISFSGDEIFNYMSAGKDTNLVLFSPYSGVWTCDTENGILENRLKMSDFEFQSEFWPFTFLPDGRLFLIGLVVDNDNEFNDIDSKQLLLKYIPVVR